ALLVAQRPQLVERAPDLVAAGALEHLRLQRHPEAGLLVERARRQHRRPVRVGGHAAARLLQLGVGEERAHRTPARNARTASRYRYGSSTYVMWPLCSNTTSVAPGIPSAIASAPSTTHVRSWRPASTSTGRRTSPSRSSTWMPP